MAAWNRSTLAGLTIAVSLALSLPQSTAADEHLIASIDIAGWLAGCWQGGEDELRSAEHWMAPDGGTMIGMSRTVRGDRTVAYELVRIVETDSDGLAYIASPSGQSTTRFDLVAFDDDRLVFENLAHDFLQRIVYRRLDAERIVARIEDESGERVIDFPMWRDDCP